MEDLVDLVDGSGNVVQRARRRSDPVPDGLHMRVVIAVVRLNGLLLVTKRTSRAAHPNAVGHISGVLRSGESPLEGAAREAYEEARVHLSEMRLVTQGVNESGHWRYLVDAYCKDEPWPSDPKEVQWVRYVTPWDIRTEVKTPGFYADLDLVRRSVR